MMQSPPNTSNTANGSSYGYNSYGPDMDAEFTFGSRNIYVDEMGSKDGVSTIGFMGDSGSISQKDQFDLMKNVQPQFNQTSKPMIKSSPPAPRPYPQHLHPSLPSDHGPTPQPSPTASVSRASHSGSPVRSSSSTQLRSGPPSARNVHSNHITANRNDVDESPTEYFSDEPPVKHEGAPGPYVTRVAEWYNQMETLGHGGDEEDGRESLVESMNGRSQATKSSLQSSEQQRPRRLFRFLVILCAIVSLLTIALVIGLTFVVIKILEKDNDAGVPKLVEMSEPPTVTPTAKVPTVSPTSSTMSPTPGEITLNLVQTLDGSHSYGTTTAIDKNWIAIGSPLVNSNSGVVSTMYNDGSGWRFIPDVTRNTANGAFGAAIDVVTYQNEAFLLAGAPESGTGNEGTAFLYKFDQSGEITVSDWELQGSLLVGQPSLSSNPENFGSAVALSGNLIAVIGAPQHDRQGISSGRIYIFQYIRESSGAYMPSDMAQGEAILGQSPNSRFGEDVDITNDGNFIVVGEPGIRSFSIFNFDGSIWLKVFQSSNSQEPNFGSSVTFLSPNYVAVGAPPANNNRGAIHVYKIYENDITIWKPLPVLDGTARGDKIGTINTVSGQEGPKGPELVIGTANGAVERYDLIGNRWVLRYSVDRPAAVTAISVYNTDDDFMVLAGHGTAQQAFIYTGSPRFGGFQTSEPTPTPTSSPTTAAPTKLKIWEINGGPFKASGSQNTDFGHSVAIAGDYIAIGEPLGRASQIGDVVIYENSENNNWVPDDTGFALNTIKFGFALDGGVVNGLPTLVVGASESFGPGSTTNLGSAHYYQRNTTTGMWGTVGSPSGSVQPTYDLSEIDAKFGYAVAMATDTYRFVVGAPESRVGSGKVYMYGFDQGEWNILGDPIVGDDNNLFGSSVAMSKSGDRVLVGAPGNRDGKGGLFYYEFNGTEWKQLFNFGGVTLEALGTSVAIIDDDAKVIAFGGPNFLNGKGIIQIYEESQPDFFTKVGNEDIVGADGDEIGTTLSGAKGRLCFGTSNGSFRVYEYDQVKKKWSRIANEPNLGAPVIAIHMADDGNSVVVSLETQEVFIYNLA